MMSDLPGALGVETSRPSDLRLDFGPGFGKCNTFVTKRTSGPLQCAGRFPAEVSAEHSRAMASVDLSSSVIDLLEGVRDDAAAALGRAWSRAPDAKRWCSIRTSARP